MSSEEQIVSMLTQQGVMIKKVLPIFLDDTTYYMDTLRCFIQEDEIELLQQCVQQNRYEEALDHAYNLKSLTGTLELDQEYLLAQQICLDIRSQKWEKPAKDVEKMQKGYDKLKGMLKI